MGHKLQSSVRVLCFPVGNLIHMFQVSTALETQMFLVYFVN